jgi:enamine deaminase RidA (YjgF/YER057c/UK114 family)
MARQIITTPNAPSSPLYSQGVKAGPHVLVSGIVGIDPSSGSLAGDTIQDQTRQALTNCEAILRAGGASLDDVIEVGVLLTHPPTSPASTRNTLGGSRLSHRPVTLPSLASNCPDCSSRSG